VLITQREALDQKWLEVRQQLPSWSMPGPKYLDAGGKPQGSRVGWPAAEPSGMIALSDGCSLVRPSPTDLRDLYHSDKRVMSQIQAQINYRIRSRQLLIRLRAKRHCYISSGLPVTSDWWPLDRAIEAIDLSIERLSGDYADKRSDCHEPAKSMEIIDCSAN
jgi:hypothetical protein